MKKYQIIPALVLLCALLSGCYMSHEWQEATCEAPKTCAKCGETEGEALGHSWQEATCEAAKACTICNIVEGEPLDHVWSEATWLDPEICTLCGKTQGIPKNYFAVNGLEVKELPETVTIQGIRYNQDNPSIQEPMVVVIRPLSCTTVVDGDFKEITVLFRANTNARWTPQINYDSLIFTMDLFDLYTGQGYPERDISDNDGYDVSFTIETKETTFELAYSLKNEWKVGDWVKISDDVYNLKAQCDFTFNFRVPVNYEGLVLAFVSRNHRDYDADDSAEINDEVVYAMEFLEEENYDSVEFFYIRDF